MQVAELVLDYVRVLIWPCLVGVLAYLFRRPVARVLDRIRRVGYPGGEAVLADEVQEAERNTRDVEKAAAEVAAQTSGLDDREQRRQTAETLAREAAEWGWRAARLSPGMRTPPKLEIEWEGEEPHIQSPANVALTIWSLLGQVRGLPKYEPHLDLWRWHVASEPHDHHDHGEELRRYAKDLRKLLGNDEADPPSPTRV